MPTISHGRAAAVTVAAGVLLGVADLLLQKTLPYPWASLARGAAEAAPRSRAGQGAGAARDGGWRWQVAAALRGAVLLAEAGF